MKLLVTGAAGFVGAYFCTALLEQGFDFVATDIMSSPDSLASILEQITYEQVDLCNDGEITSLVEKYKPTHIIHLAAMMADVAEANPPLAFKINFMSTAHLLAAGMQNGLKRFVIATTIGIYHPDTPEPVTDNAIKYPANIYGMTKLSSEYLMEWYERNHGLSVAGVRLPWIYGPGRRRGTTANFTTKLLDGLAKGEDVYVPNPQERGDWMYGIDAARALMVMVDPGEKQKQFAYYFAGAGIYTIGEVMTIAQQFCPEASLSFNEKKDVASTYTAEFDDSSTKRDFGWEAEYDIEKAIKAHIAAVR